MRRTILVTGLVVLLVAAPLMSGSSARVSGPAQFADVLSRTRVPFQPLSIATGFGSVWVAGDLGVSRIDPGTDAIVAEVSVGGVASVAANEAGLWISSYVQDQVARIDPSTNEVVWTTNVTGPVRLAIGEGALWASSPMAGTVTKLDPATGAVMATITVLRDVPAVLAFGSESSNQGFAPGLAVGEGSVWVAVRSANKLVRIDPSTDRVSARISLGGTDPVEVAVGDGYVWVNDFNEELIRRVDPHTLLVQAFPLPDYASQILTAPEGVWVSTFHYASLVAGTGSAGVLELDPQSGQVERYLKIHPAPAGGYWAIALGFGDLWVTTSHFEEAVDDMLFRIDPSRSLDHASIPTVIEPTAGVLPVTVAQSVPFTSGQPCQESGRDCQQLTDVYTPTSSGTHPVVVLAHGNCGPAGCKRYLGNLADVLALGGAVVFNVDYGDPQHQRSNLELRTSDLACAVRFARAHAADYGGDPSRVTLVAHLAAAQQGGIVALDGDARVGASCLALSGSASPDAFVAIADAPGRDEMPPLGGNPGLEVRLLIGARDAKMIPTSAERVDGFLSELVAAGYDATLTVIPHATYGAYAGHGAIDVGSDRPTVDTILDVASS